MKTGTQIKLRAFPRFRGTVAKVRRNTVWVVWHDTNPHFTPGGQLMSGVIKAVYRTDIKKA